MRLRQKEISSLTNVFKKYKLLPDCKVFLFGSRLDINKKGGDIDLLLLCPENQYKNILEKKLLIKSELEFSVDDQRVDLTLTTLNKLKTDPFLLSIQNQIRELI